MSSLDTYPPYDIFTDIQMDIDRLAEAERLKEMYSRVIESLVRRDLESGDWDVEHCLDQLLLSDIDGLSSSTLFMLDQSPIDEMMHVDEASIPSIQEILSHLALGASSPSFNDVPMNDSISVTSAGPQVKTEDDYPASGPFTLRPVMVSDWSAAFGARTVAITPSPPCFQFPSNDDSLIVPQPVYAYRQPDSDVKTPERVIDFAETEQVRSLETPQVEDEPQSPESEEPSTKIEDDNLKTSEEQETAESLTPGNVSHLNETHSDSDVPRRTRKTDKTPRPKRRLSCPYVDCSFSTNRKWDLERHNCTHTGEKRYPCPWPGCYERFMRIEPRNSHYLLHTDDRPPRKTRRWSYNKRVYRRKKGISYGL